MKISEAMKLLEGYDLLLVMLGLAILAASALPRLFAHKPLSLPLVLLGLGSGAGKSLRGQREALLRLAADRSGLGVLLQIRKLRVTRPPAGGDGRNAVLVRSVENTLPLRRVRSVVPLGSMLLEVLPAE